jgi:hypothetical protein
MSTTPPAAAQSPAAQPQAQRVSFTEGSVQLPAGYEDRTANVLVPPNPQAQPNLNIARDTMKPGETLTTYIDRQIALLKSQLGGHRTLAREAIRLGPPSASASSEEDANMAAVTTGLIGESIDATFKSGKSLIFQRQAAFVMAPSRVLIFTASTLQGFGPEFEKLWSGWLASYQPPTPAQQPTDAHTASDEPPPQQGR